MKFLSLPFILWALLALTGYSLHEADSLLYSGQAAELASRPFNEWIAPEWYGLWGVNGLFREHPPFLLWVFALSVKVLGVHGPVVAHYAFLLLFPLMGLSVGRALQREPSFAPFVASALVLMPIMLQYQLRANMETPATAMLLLALAPMITRDERTSSLLLIALGVAGTLLFKGIASLFGLLFVFTLWLTHPTFKRAAAVMAGVLGFVAIAIWYEHAYVARTGEMFWSAYAQIQRGHSNAGDDSFLSNVVWYALRGIYYALPWSAACLLLAKRRPKDTRWLAMTLTSLLCMLIAAAFSRRAERYVFAIYPALAIAGAWSLYEAAPRLRAWLAQRSSKLSGYLYTLMLFLLVARVLIGHFAYVRIAFWR